MTDMLDTLAARYQIATRYTGLDGVEHPVPDATKRAILAAIGVSADSEADIARALAAAPPVLEEDKRLDDVRCYIPDWLEHRGCWGITLQVYALRSARNWGIGDFADLAAMARTAAAAGADFLGTNPLHATFVYEPDRRSPFFPSTRRFLNPLYIAVDAVPGFDTEMVDASTIAAARTGDLVDYDAVAQLKLAALHRLWPVWQQQHEQSADYSHAAFEAFVAAGGETLRRHALFDAIAGDMARNGHRSRWVEWPEAFQSAGSAEVESFAATHADDVAFHSWLQWLASVQLRAAQDAALAAGMRIGLYLDFAVGEAPDGSATWGAPERSLRGVHIGAPPDYFSTTGQDWAIAPISPTALRTEPEAAYGELIASSMRHCGALRIDHAMALKQLFLVPAGALPAAGSYVRYPTRQMLEALSAASHAHRTIVIGEDLGYVPPGFRDLMGAVRLLSYRILYFERHENGFLPPWDYPGDALACVATHDLPTIEGWWRGADVDLRQSFGLIDTAAAEHQIGLRRTECDQLLQQLVQGGLLDEAQHAQAVAAVLDPDLPLPPALIVAIHIFLARTPSRMLAVRLEDLVGETQPVNLPGTVDDYPNWKRKLGVAIEAVGDLELFGTVTAALAAQRPRG